MLKPEGKASRGPSAAKARQNARMGAGDVSVPDVGPVEANQDRQGVGAREVVFGKFGLSGHEGESGEREELST